jgi:methionyl-tRNA synthetase
VEEIDVGEAQPRTVVSGLVKYIPEAEMQGRRVVLVCNLKPATMRGVRSEAMVLAATSADGAGVELVEPPEGAAVGERVAVEGFPGEPDAQLPPKKKVWEAVQPELATDGARRACYRGAPLATAAGACTVRTIVGGSIK